LSQKHKRERSHAGILSQAFMYFTFSSFFANFLSGLVQQMKVAVIECTLYTLYILHVLM